MGKGRNHKVPVLTLILISACLIVAFLVFLQPQLLDSLAFQPQNPDLIMVLACLFVHVNVIHLLGNLVFLAAVGPILEFSKGPLKTGIVYLVSGISGVLFYWLISSRNPNALPLVGASGAISGVVAFCAVRYMRTKVPIFVNLAVPVGLLAVIWLGLQIGGAFLQIGDVNAADSGFWPHLGGILAGLILSAIMGANSDAKREFGHAVLDQMNERGPSASLAAAKQHLANHPDDPKALWQKARAEIDLDQNEEASATLLKLLDLEPLGKKPDVISQLQKLGSLSQLSVSDRLKLADTFKADHTTEAKIVLQSIISEPKSERTPDAIIGLIELSITENPQETEKLKTLLLTEFELHPATEFARKKGLIK